MLAVSSSSSHGVKRKPDEPGPTCRTGLRRRHERTTKTFSSVDSLAAPFSFVREYLSSGSYLIKTLDVSKKKLRIRLWINGWSFGVRWMDEYHRWSKGLVWGGGGALVAELLMPPGGAAHSPLGSEMLAVAFVYAVSVGFFTAVLTRSAGQSQGSAGGAAEWRSEHRRPLRCASHNSVMALDLS